MKNEKPKVVKIHDVQIDREYIQWIGEIKSRYRSAQIKAAVKVNAEQLLFNWQLGRDLVIRKAEEKWGSGIVEQVSLDLQEAFSESKGFSPSNLWRMKQWYLFYAQSAEKLAQLGRELTASQNSPSLGEKLATCHLRQMTPLHSQNILHSFRGNTTLQSYQNANPSRKPFSM